jgi:hypothetical protein
VRLLGRAVTRGPLWPVAGVGVHCANGAIFGVVFERVGLRGPAAGVAAAEIEHVALWPAVALVDRSLLRDGRVFAQEAAMHALFGAVLGVLMRG